MNHMQAVEKILIVDDAQTNLDIISGILEEDYKLETALDGEKALKKAKSFKPGIVLLDIMMPGLDGYEVCKKIRNDPDLSSAKIILISAKHELEDRLIGYEAGADDYIKKPFDQAELLAKTKVFSRLNGEERKSKQLNRLLLSRQQDIPNVLWECDKKLKFTFIDENITPLLGFDAQEMLGKPMSKLIHKGKKEFDSTLKAKLMSTNPSLRGVPFLFKSKEKQKIKLQVFADAVFDENNNIIGMGGMFRDMSAFNSLLEVESAKEEQLSIQIDSTLEYRFSNEFTANQFPIASGNKTSDHIKNILDDSNVENLLQFAFDQNEDVPFPIEVTLTGMNGDKHPFAVDLKFQKGTKLLEGILNPTSAQGNLDIVSHRIENQSQIIKDQEESLKNAIIMDDETRQHITQDAHNLAGEILSLVKSLDNFSFPDDGIFNFEELCEFVSRKNLQVYSENLRLLGNKIHGLKGSCGFLIEPAKTLCHQMEEITRRLADFELLLTHSLSNLLKQFIFKIEEMLEVLNSGKEGDLEIESWLIRIEKSLASGLSFISGQEKKVCDLIKQRSVDNGEIRTRKREEYVSVSLDGYESLSEKVKDLYYSLTGSLNEEQLVQSGSLFNQFLSTHQEIKKVPLVLTRYERLIPKLAKDYGKDADFQFIDNGVKADREFWDSVHEILNHMLKNAVIHGIEPNEKRKEMNKNPSGKVTVELKEDALHILLTVSDDGQGLDTKRISKKALESGLYNTDQLDAMSESDLFDLLFLTGFSTADNLDDNAGRGVGMNAVKEVMLQHQGECSITSSPGEGCQWHLSFLKSNVSLACIIVAVSDVCLAIPEDYVDTFIDYGDDNKKTVKQAPMYKYDGQLIPLVDEEKLFESRDLSLDTKNRSVVVLKNTKEKKGLIINRIIHHAVQPILPLPKVYRNVPIYQGITIYNNEPVPVVNIEKLF